MSLEGGTVDLMRVPSPRGAGRHSRREKWVAGSCSARSTSHRQRGAEGSWEGDKSIRRMWMDLRAERASTAAWSTPNMPMGCGDRWLTIGEVPPPTSSSA